MVFPYPEFHGRNDESVEEFLEKMEVACISKIVAPIAIVSEGRCKDLGKSL